MLRAIVPVAIGVVAVLSQPAVGTAQRGVTGDAAELAVASDRAGPTLERFRSTLGPRGTGTWAEGWSLAQSLGSAALPVLERICREERNSAGRHAVLLAMVRASASGPSIANYVVRRLADADEPRERLVILLALATGPNRVPDEALALTVAELMGSKYRLSTRLGACLAARRLGIRPPDSLLGATDPGLAAAARWCAASEDDPELERWLASYRDNSADSSAGIVLRAALLGLPPAGVLPPGLESRAREEIQKPLGDAVADAATSAGVRSPAFVVRALEVAPLRGPVALRLAAARELRGRLLDEVVRYTASTRATPNERARAAAIVALEVPIQNDPAALGAWWKRMPGDAPDVRNAFCLALAYRVFDQPKLAGSVSLADLPRCAATAWVEAACGAAPSADDSARPTDLAVARGLALARAGQLAGRPAARFVEDILWRSGAHPGRFVFEAELDLVRDLLLTGSEFGRVSAGVDERAEVYFPKGLPRGDRVYEVAVTYASFVRDSTPQPPAALRLH